MKKVLITLATVICAMLIALCMVGCDFGSSDGSTGIAGHTYIFDSVIVVYCDGDQEYSDSVKKQTEDTMNNMYISFNRDGTCKMYNTLGYDKKGTFTKKSTCIVATIDGDVFDITVAMKSITVVYNADDFSVVMNFVESGGNVPPNDDDSNDDDKKCKHKDTEHVVAVQESTCAVAGYSVDIYFCKNYDCMKVFENLAAIESDDYVGKIHVDENTLGDMVEIDYETGEYKWKAPYFKTYGTRLPLLEHTPEAVPAVSPTCVVEGFTESVACSVCKQYIEKPQSIGYGQHDYTDGLLGDDYDYMCQSCGKLRDRDVKFYFRLNDDGESYTLWHIDYNSDDTKLVIPSMFDGMPVTSVTGIFEDAQGLRGCNVFNDTFLNTFHVQIEEIVIAYGVTNIGNGTFSRCNKLKSVVMPDSVTSIGWGAFHSCSSLTSVEMSSNLTSIDSIAFYNCSSLESIVIPNCLTNIGDSAFDGCDSITAVTMPTIAISTVTNHCKNKIETVVINGGDSIGDYAFYGCSSLTSIEIPNSVTSIGSSAFRGCSGLTSITIPNSVTDIGSEAFLGCDKLIQTEYEVQYVDKWAIGYCNQVSSIILRSDTVGIGDAAFYGCSSLTSIEIPNSVMSIGNSAFQACWFLSSIKIPNSVTSIGNKAFMNCDSLTSIEISDSVASIGSYAFYSCSLTSIEIPNGVISIGSYAFMFCKSLTSIEIPNSVISIGNGLFRDCESLTSIVVQNENSKYHSAGNCLIETESKTLIAGCGNSIIPSDGSVEIIGNYAFCDCYSLTSIEIPNNVMSIGNWAFNECGLTSIEIPNNVTSIGDRAFSNCSSLTSVTIGNSVTSIGSYAFYGCNDLTTIRYNGTKDEWKSISKGANWSMKGDYVVICTDGTLTKEES